MPDRKENHPVERLEAILSWAQARSASPRAAERVEVRLSADAMWDNWGNWNNQNTRIEAPGT